MTNETNFQTFIPGELLPSNLVLPRQSHSARLVEIVTGNEDLNDCDGVWSRNSHFNLGVKTADCAPICFWNDTQFGVIHAGWRGTVNGIIENMLAITESDTQFWIGPILPQFEIQKDACYEQIHTKFGSQFFIVNKDQILFNFKACLSHLLPSAQFDPRVTAEDLTLSSWRRDKHFENGQNTTIIRRF